jgi:16S rRNA (guanine1207-N2)-methyltransferase
MAEPTSLAVLRAALPRLCESLPPTPRIDVYRAQPGLSFGVPAGIRWRAEQGFRPLHASLLAEGLATSGEPSTTSAGDGAPLASLEEDRPDAIVVLPPRSREEGRALLARALIEVAEGGVVLGAALNDEGAKSFEKDLAALAPLAGVLSKAHGRAFWTVAKPAVIAAESLALAERWLAADAPRRDAATGLWTRVGVFNEGRLDAGSALLLEHLPKSLRGRVADLGAGSGLLARAVIERCPAVTALELFEAEARAVDLARRNLAGARVPVGIHWHDVAGGVLGEGRARFDAIVCNPPFHVGARSVPALGRAFIAAAAQALAKDGQLLLVANRHLPYEEELRSVFAHGEALAEQGGFKVYRAWSPKAGA